MPYDCLRCNADTMKLNHPPPNHAVAVAVTVAFYRQVSNFPLSSPQEFQDVDCFCLSMHEYVCMRSFTAASVFS